jgi:hypothetical protein
MAPRKEACIFLIDSSITMEDHIGLACDTVSAMIEHRIMQGASNEVGLMLFGECTFFLFPHCSDSLSQRVLQVNMYIFSCVGWLLLDGNS